MLADRVHVIVDRDVVVALLVHEKTLLGGEVLDIAVAVAVLDDVNRDLGVVVPCSCARGQHLASKVADPVTRRIDRVLENVVRVDETVVVVVEEMLVVVAVVIVGVERELVVVEEVFVGVERELVGVTAVIVGVVRGLVGVVSVGATRLGRGARGRLATRARALSC